MCYHFDLSCAIWKTEQAATALIVMRGGLSRCLTFAFLHHEFQMLTSKRKLLELTTEVLCYYRRMARRWVLCMVIISTPRYTNAIRASILKSGHEYCILPRVCSILTVSKVPSTNLLNGRFIITFVRVMIKPSFDFMNLTCTSLSLGFDKPSERIQYTCSLRDFNDTHTNSCQFVFLSSVGPRGRSVFVTRDYVMQQAVDCWQWLESVLE